MGNTYAIKFDKIISLPFSIPLPGLCVERQNFWLTFLNVSDVLCLLSDDDDDEYDGGFEEPVIVTESGDQHGNAFDNADDGFADEVPQVGIVHGSGDGLYFTDYSVSLQYTEF